MNERLIIPTEKHQAFRDDLIAILRRLDLDAKEMLAISAYLVGQIVAMQDQRTVTPKMAMEIVAKNIEAGNKQAIAEVSGKPKGSA